MHALPLETQLSYTAEAPLGLIIVQAGLKLEIRLLPNTGMMSLCHYA